MPYIQNVETRKRHQKAAAIAISAGETFATPGDLNHAITALVLEWVAQQSGGGVSTATYAILNDAIGALECAKQEFYRRVVVPLEEKKRAVNGDVFPKLEGV
jgi:hypothetical protein